MEKPTYVPIYILVATIVLAIASSIVESDTLETKLLFITKIGLIVGLIGLWLFTILPMWKKKKNNRN